MKSQKVKPLATIAANDDHETGDTIILGVRPHEAYPEKGWMLCASNGDKIGFLKPQTIAKCKSDLADMYGRTWITFQWLD